MIDNKVLQTKKIIFKRFKNTENILKTFQVTKWNFVLKNIRKLFF